MEERSKYKTNNQLSLFAHNAAERLQTSEDWSRENAALILADGEIKGMTSYIIVSFAHVMRRIVKDLEDNGGRGMSPLATGEFLSRMSNSFFLLSRSIGKIDPALNELAITQTILRHLETFIRANYPQHMPAFAEILVPFAEEIQRIFQK